MSTRLSRSDWIHEALRLLMRGGADSVRVEPLAKALNVTKGSFYWHFKDRTALCQAMLETWQARATHAVIDEVENVGGDALARLTTLFTIVSGTDGRLERIIRSWAAVDTMARTALESVDARRLGYVDDLFRQLGFPPVQAIARARLAYHALIGQYAMDSDMTAQERIAERVGIILPILVRNTD